MSAERYSRQEMLPEFAGTAPRLAKARVGIAGCGGLGGLCAYLLAAAGVGTLRLADGDAGSLSNLHRQVMLDLESIGQNKALCVKARIAALNPELEVSCTGMLGPENFAAFAEGLDLLLILTDSQKSRIELSNLALRQRLDVVECAVSGWSGILAPFCYSKPGFIREFGCYSCLAGTLGEVTAAEKLQQGGQGAVVGVTGPAAAQMSAAAASLALSMLTDSLDPSFVGFMRLFDLKTQRVQKFKLKRSDDCPECTHAD